MWYVLLISEHKIKKLYDKPTAYRRTFSLNAKYYNIPTSRIRDYCEIHYTRVDVGELSFVYNTDIETEYVYRIIAISYYYEGACTVRTVKLSVLFRTETTGVEL